MISNVSDNRPARGSLGDFFLELSLALFFSWRICTGTGANESW
jgi:hypothetical protein